MSDIRRHSHVFTATLKCGYQMFVGKIQRRQNVFQINAADLNCKCHLNPPNLSKTTTGPGSLMNSCRSCCSCCSFKQITGFSQIIRPNPPNFSSVLFWLEWPWNPWKQVKPASPLHFEAFYMRPSDCTFARWHRIFGKSCVFWRLKVNVYPMEMIQVIDFSAAE